MVVYWLMFLIPVFILMVSGRGAYSNRDSALKFVCFIFVFLIGFRFQVGGDWGAYLRMYDTQLGMSLFDTLTLTDPGYALLNWLVASLGLGIYAVNLVCGAIVMVGLFYFCRRQPQPMLALLIATPYMVIVVAMGYTRQSVALGFELLALIALTDRRLWTFILFIACASLFHKSAVMLFPLAVLGSTQNKLWVYLSIGSMFLLLANALLFEHSDALVENYVTQQMQSAGGQVRVAMIALPSAFFLMFSKRLAPDDKERKLWFWIAVLSLACVPLVFIASTAVDRIALYFLPIQLYVYTRIAGLIRNSSNRMLFNIGVIGVYGLVEWVLLYEAVYIPLYWVPYDNAAFFW